MYLHWILSCVLFAAVSGNVVRKENDVRPELKWPKKYTLQAYKMSLTSGLVEDVTYWRTSKKSRVDYNNGAVNVIRVKGNPRKLSFGVKYEVHPVSTETEKDVLVCTRFNGSFGYIVKLDKILPDADIFESVGKDILDQGEVEKFTANRVEDDIDRRQTLWASYDHKNKTWIPIKHEEIKYDTWLDISKEHEIWHFYNFDTDFNETKFDIEPHIDCEDSDEQPDDGIKVDDNDHPRSVDPDNDDHIDRVFNAFKQNHKKIYANEEENAVRRNIFQRRLRLVLENNRENTGYKLAINKFADRTPQEMKKYMGLIRQSKRENCTHPFPYTKEEVQKLASDLPKTFDLRDLGVITPVRDQQACGSCWTFGTTSAVEGALARSNGGRLVRLANQALIDCAWGFGGSGCDGGSDIVAYKWMMKHGLPTEEEYGPYKNKDGFCRIDNMTKTYPIRGFTNVTPYSVEALKVALINHGPLSVSIDATDAIYLYYSGIFYDTTCDPTVLNHEVTLVGYGQSEGDEYWIVKNSWGQRWGVDGYLHISVRDNSCGITYEPTYVVI